MPRSKVTASQKSKHNTKWLNNAMKSIGVAASDTFKEIAPNIFSATSSSIEISRGMVQKIRTNKTSLGQINRALMGSKYIDLARKTIDQSINDIREGNLYSPGRGEEALLSGGDDDWGDWNFGDEEDEEGESSVTFNVIEGDDEKTANATLSVAEAVSKGTEAQLRASKASVDAMVSLSSNALMQQQEAFEKINLSLSNIDNTTSAILSYHQENTSNFYEKMIAAVERMGSAVAPDEPMSSSDNDKMSVFNKNGGINLNAYQEHIKRQIRGSLENSPFGMLLPMLEDENMLKMMVADPIGGLTKGVIGGMIPSVIQGTLKELENTFTDLIPNLLHRMGNWAKDENASSFKRMIGSIFGMSFSSDSRIDLQGKVSKDAATFDGVTRNAITEILPKYARESTSYLREIALHITKKSEKDILDNSDVFDVNTSSYRKKKDLYKELAADMESAISDAFSSTKFEEALAAASTNFSKKEQESYDKLRRQMYVQFVRNGGIDVSDFNFDKNSSAIHDIMNNIGDGSRRDEKMKDVLIQSLKYLYANNTGIGDASFATTRALQNWKDKTKELSNEYDLRHLVTLGINEDTDLYDFLDEFTGNKASKVNRDRLKAEQEAQEKKAEKKRIREINRLSRKSRVQQALMDWKDGNDESLRSGSSGRIADSVLGDNFGKGIRQAGQHVQNGMWMIMKGDTRSAMTEFSSIFTDQMKNMWTGLKQNFLSPLSENLFGKKNEESGEKEGGLFGSARDKVRDTYRSFLQQINGRDYVNSKGETVKLEDQSQTLVSKVSKVFTDLKDGVRERLFGKKEKEGDDEEAKEGIITKMGNALSSGLKGWSDFIFGNEDAKEEEKKRIKDEMVKAAPDALMGTGIGAIMGGLIGQSSLLGMAVGGPIGGAVIGLAGGLLSRSEKFKDYLFGPEVEQDGEKKRIGGLISAKTQSFLKENKKNILGGAAIGLLKTAIVGPGTGLMTTILGGPVAGAAMGIGLGLLKKSDMFQKFLYGDEEKGTKGIVEAFKGIFKRSQDESGDPKEKKSLLKSIGMGSLGALGGGFTAALVGKVGLLGALASPAGLIGGAVLGATVGIAGSSKKFGTWLFGEKDPDTKERKGGMLSKFGNYLHVEVMAPLRSKAMDFIDDIKTTVKWDILENIRQPFVAVADGLRENLTKFQDFVKKKGTAFYDATFGKAFKGLGTAIHNVFVKPVRFLADKVSNVLYVSMRSAVTMPFKVIGYVTKAVMSPVGKLVQLAGKAITKSVGFLTKKFLGLGGKVLGMAGKLFAIPFALGKHLFNGARNMLPERKKDRKGIKERYHRLASFLGITEYNKEWHERKAERAKEKGNDKTERINRRNMDWNRQQMAKMLGYDVKYFTEENYELAKEEAKRQGKKIDWKRNGKMRFEEDKDKIRRDILTKRTSEITDTLETSEDPDMRILNESHRTAEAAERLEQRAARIVELMEQGLTKEEAEDVVKQGDRYEEEHRRAVGMNEDGTVNFDEIEEADEEAEEGGTRRGRRKKQRGKKRRRRRSRRRREGEDPETEHIIDILDDPDALRDYLEGNDQARAEGGPMKAGKPYLVGEGGKDPAGAEIVVPDTDSTVLSQKDGGIKVHIAGIEKEVLERLIDIQPTVRKKRPAEVKKEEEAKKEEKKAEEKIQEESKKEVLQKKKGETFEERVNRYTSEMGGAGGFFNWMGGKISGKAQNFKEGVKDRIYNSLPARMFRGAASVANFIGNIPGATLNNARAIGNFGMGALGNLGKSLSSDPDDKLVNVAVKDEDGSIDIVRMTEEQETMQRLVEDKDSDQQRAKARLEEHQERLDDVKKIGAFDIDERKRKLQEEQDRKTALSLQQKISENTATTAEETKKTGFNFASIFSKKGLLVGGLIAMAPAIIGFVKNVWPVIQDIGDALKNFGLGVVNDGVRTETEKERTNGESISERIQDNTGDLGEVGASLAQGEYLDAAGNFVLDEGEFDAGSGARANLLMKGAHKVGRNARKVYRAGKAVVKGVKNVAKGAKTVVKGGKKLVNTALGKTATKTAETGVKEVVESGGKGLLDKVTDLFKTGIEKLAKKLAEKFPKVGNISAKLLQKLPKITGPLSKHFPKIATKISVAFSKGAAAVSTLGLSTLTFVVGGAINGATAAKRLFQTDETDWKMVAISTVFGALLTGTTFGTIFEIVNDLLADVLGIDLIHQAAVFVYQLVSSKEDFKDYQNDREAFISKYHEYQDAEIKKAYDKQLEDGTIDKNMTFEEFQAEVETGNIDVEYKSFQDYNAEQHQSLGYKIGKGFTAVGKGIKAAGGAIAKGAKAVGGAIKGGVKAIGKGASAVLDVINPVKNVQRAAKFGQWLLKTETKEIYKAADGSYYDADGKHFNANGTELGDSIDIETLSAWVSSGNLEPTEMVTKEAGWKQLLKGGVETANNAFKKTLELGATAVKKFKNAGKKVFDTAVNVSISCRNLFTHKEKAWVLNDGSGYYKMIKTDKWQRYNVHGDEIGEPITNDEMGQIVKSGIVSEGEVKVDGKIKKKLVELGDNVKKTFDGLLTTGKEMFGKVKKVAGGFINSVKKNGLFGAISKGFERTKKKAWYAVDGTGYYLMNNSGKFDFYSMNGDKIDSRSDVEPEKIEEMMGSGLLKEGEILENSDAQKAIKTITNAVKDAWNKAGETVKSGWDSFTKWLTGGSGTGASVSAIATDPNKTASNSLNNKALSVIQQANAAAGNTASTNTTNNKNAKLAAFGGRGEVEEAETGPVITDTPDRHNNFAYFAQDDPRWGNSPYVSGINDGGTMANAGCGPTAMAMVATQATKGKTITPMEMANIAASSGYRDETGTNEKFISDAGSALGLGPSESLTPSGDEIFTRASKGIPMILNGMSGNSGPFTDRGHYIVTVGTDARGNVLVNDPRGKGYSKAYSAEELAKSVRKAWTFQNVQLANKTGLGKFGGNGNRRIFGKRFGGFDGPNGDWLSIVKSVKALIAEQKPGYSQSNYINITYNGKTLSVRTDCSGYVTACLKYYGSAGDGANYTSSTLCSSSLNIPGFSYVAWPGWEGLQCGDIVARSGHTEIFSHIGADGKHYVWNCGSDSSTNTPDPVASAKDSYTSVWRPGNAGSGANVVSTRGTTDGTSTTSSSTGGFTDVISKIGSAFSQFASKALNGLLTGNWDTTIDLSDNATGTSATGTTSGEFNPASIDPSNEKQSIWNFFRNTMGYTPEATAAVMGNMEQESGNHAVRVQGDFTPGYTKSQEYTKQADNGGSFVGDKKGYGLIQWTYGPIKQELLNNAKAAGKSVGDLGVQLSTIKQSLEGGGVLGNELVSMNNSFKTNTDMLDATKLWLNTYEKPGGDRNAEANRRMGFAQAIYNEYNKPTTSPNPNNVTMNPNAGLSAYGKGIPIVRKPVQSNRKYGGFGDTTRTGTTYITKSTDVGTIDRTLVKGTVEQTINATDTKGMEKLLATVVELLQSINGNTGTLNQLPECLANVRSGGNVIVDNRSTNSVASTAKTASSTVSKNSILAKKIAKG